MIMNLQTNKLVLKITFDLEIITGLDIKPKNVIDIIADEIRIRKNYDGFSISSFGMNYEVHKNEEMMDV